LHCRRASNWRATGQAHCLDLFLIMELCLTVKGEDGTWGTLRLPDVEQRNRVHQGYVLDSPSTAPPLLFGFGAGD
jgi:hypothetical protein